MTWDERLALACSSGVLFLETSKNKRMGSIGYLFKAQHIICVSSEERNTKLRNLIQSGSWQRAGSVNSGRRFDV
jgi:hypothetical protein